MKVSVPEKHFKIKAVLAIYFVLFIHEIVWTEFRLERW